MKILFDLFLTFAKVGLFTFGGGYAMIGMIESYCVDKKKWITHDELMNVTVIAESTPGPIAINCATYTGYKRAGIVGSIAATLGMIVPSFLIIYLISIFLDNFLEYEIITNAFKGIKIGVGILILNAAFTMIKKMHRKALPRAIMLCSFASMLIINLFALKFSTISLMVICGALSLMIFILSGSPDKKGGGAR